MRISDWSSDVCSSDLSRAVEEGGTLVSPLIPWNAGGAFVISALALGVSSGNMENLLYIPLAFACWMSPVIGIVYAHTGLFSPRATDAERRGGEIGRASCRERACQYVWISVGAEYSK